MCGRFDQSQSTEKYLHAIDWPTPINNSAVTARFNVAPGMYRPVMHVDQGQLMVDDLHWGYQASWAVGKIPVTINTRLEKISGKYWSRLLKNGRAVVAADGWYEWTGEKGTKQPWHIHRADGAPIFMAALANFGPAADDNKATAGFTIVTADALGGMVDVHDRRPVVFSAEDARLWMNPDLPGTAAEQIARVQALGPKNFAWHQVSKLVGNVRNDGPALAQPLPPS
ncbi:MAG: SOS response-associated peptidase [Burkholderiaceae bacterium]